MTKQHQILTSLKQFKHKHLMTLTEDAYQDLWALIRKVEANVTKEDPCYECPISRECTECPVYIHRDIEE